MDNNTYIDQYFLGEPAFSVYIEDGAEKILFDTGYSDAFIRNAEEMQIDLGALTYIVLSHGHNDHSRGLTFLWDKYDLQNVKLVAHPGLFAPKRYMGLDVGAPFTKEDCLAHGLQVIDGSKPVQITERLTFLGEIPRVTSFESKEPIGECTDTGLADFVMDDSALAYEGKEGMFIVTGCSHSGICNIVLQALRCSEEKSSGCASENNKSYGRAGNVSASALHEEGKHKTVSGIIGGFHLLKKNQQLTETIRFLEQHTKGMLYPCHCVSFAAKHEMMNTLPLTEVGVGLQLEI
jgi:7,8-dihydropterin-6-yl-methyl-4-(beta-D-ribofuranosyl)aminobenzene 5'-phosphate synthase